MREKVFKLSILKVNLMEFFKILKKKFVDNNFIKLYGFRTQDWQRFTTLNLNSNKFHKMFSWFNDNNRSLAEVHEICRIIINIPSSKTFKEKKTKNFWESHKKTTGKSMENPPENNNFSSSQFNNFHNYLFSFFFH